MFSSSVTLLTLYIFHALLDGQADRPTLPECVSFQGREKRINIPQEISVKYYKFGLLLLEDDTGAKIRSIAHEHRDNTEQINMEVLRQWINGRGKQPVTWKTLIEVLHDIELSTLAREIEAVKCCEGEPIGNVPVRTSDDPIQKDQMTLSTVKTTEDSDRRSTRDIPTAGMENKHCETLEQRVNVADCEDSNKKEKNQLARNSEAEILTIGCEESEENQENQVTNVLHGTAPTDTRPLQDEVQH